MLGGVGHKVDSEFRRAIALAILPEIVVGTYEELLLGYRLVKTAEVDLPYK